jgi:hypothetical protein
MADYQFNTNLGPAAQPTTSLSDMVNLARGVQAYQQQGQLNPLQLQKAQMDIEQAEKLNPLAVRKATEEVSQAEIGTKEKQLGFTDKQQQMIFDELGTLQADPRWLNAAKDKRGAVEALMEREDRLKAKGIDPVLLRSSAAPMYQTIEQKPELVSQVVKNIIQRGGNEKQFSQLNAPARFVNTGQMAIPIYESPYQGGGAGKTPAVPMQITPAEQESLVQDPYSKNMLVVTKDANGNVISSRPAPGGSVAGGGGGGGGGGFQTLPSGETAATADAAKAIQLQANKAATTVQTSQYNNNKIVELADKALVGANAETLAKLGGGYAIAPWTSNATQNRQILGHQLALETATLASSANLGTDAARGLAEKMSGTTEWTPEAIKSTARMNRALTTSTDMFNRGVNSAVEKANNSPFAARDFQNKWSTQEQLLPTLQFVDAMRNAKADPEGAREMIKSVGGYGSEGYKDMLKRAGKLNDLITKGQ